jgi:hypothetical protein
MDRIWEAEVEVMYTVAVLGESLSTRSTLEALVEVLNRQSSFEAFSPRWRGGGYACDICNSDDWSAHLSAVDKFLSEHEELLRPAVDGGVSLRFDTGIDSDTLGIDSPWNTFSYPADVVQRLAISHASVAITIYQTEEG